MHVPMRVNVLRILLLFFLFIFYLSIYSFFCVSSPVAEKCEQAEARLV